MSQDVSPNPLLLQWVKEWWDTAKQQNSKGMTTYKNAYESLKRCPIAYQHPSELQQLKGFGPKLCERLTEKMRAYCVENNIPIPAYPTKKRRSKKAGPANLEGDEEDEDDESSRPAKKPRKTKPYVPALRSGSYALLLALSTLDENSRVGMTKPELIEAAQPHCDASFTAPPDPTKFYTAWASMKTLCQKDLVYEKGRPLKKYVLTEEGWEVAKRMRQAVASGSARNAEALPNSASRSASTATAVHSSTSVRQPLGFLDEDDASPLSRRNIFENVVPDGDAVPDESALPIFTPARMPPGSFTVELVLDIREVRAKTDRDYMQNQLTKKGIKPIMRALEIGDALWVAKCHRPDWLKQHGAEGEEVVLDWIVERKRLDDLIGSIKDGRFHEQKFRLRRSGVKNVIYLVEEISLDSGQLFKYEEAMQSAMASIQVVNGYFLKRTQLMDETIRYLASMTRLLKKVYEDKPLYVVPTKALTAKNYLPLLKHLREKQPSLSHHISYEAFASLASKSEMMTLRDVYLKMLMCTRGVTGEKAIEIQKIWKTPNQLIRAFEQCGSGEEGKKRKLNLVSERLSHLVGRKKIPKPVCQKIAEVWADL
ncbi:ERCC4 domain-containing protein [Podospora didyma]|uniref:Crossover junction endonuclease MUS81 n=1 Tax=Podospora didyma TaxID=330526 RepID=A0AAE0P5M2_9PEZI|nr:ERCC4 domain-containing protein [Podospora didyma]